MADNVTLVVEGFTIHNYVSTSASGSAPEPAPGAASAGAAAGPGPASTNACPNSPPAEGFSNTPTSNSTEWDMMRLMLGSQKQILREIKEIKEAQEKSQKDIAVFKQDKEWDREKYSQLQHQYKKLKQKKEETTSRLKALTKEKCELATTLMGLKEERESLQNEVDKLQERQASDDQKHLSEIQNKESEIEDLKKNISELEEKLASSDELHRTNALHIGELDEEIKRLKEKKEIIESENIELLNDVDMLIKPSSRSRVEMKLGRELTVNSFSSNIESNNITESPRLPSQLDKRKTRPMFKSFTNPGYTTPRPLAFIGTTSSKTSHNVVHKKKNNN